MGELKERFISVYNNAIHRDGSDNSFCDGWRIPISSLHQHPQSSTAAMKVGFFSIP